MTVLRFYDKETGEVLEMHPGACSRLLRWCEDSRSWHRDDCWWEDGCSCPRPKAFGLDPVDYGVEEP